MSPVPARLRALARALGPGACAHHPATRRLYGGRWRVAGPGRGPLITETWP